MTIRIASYRVVREDGELWVEWLMGKTWVAVSSPGAPVKAWEQFELLCRQARYVGNVARSET